MCIMIIIVLWYEHMFLCRQLEDEIRYKITNTRNIPNVRVIMDMQLDGMCEIYYRNRAQIF
jgi:hypothetical protein